MTDGYNDGLDSWDLARKDKIVVIKSQETRSGVRFRILKNEGYQFADIKFNNYFYVKKNIYDIHKDAFHQKFNYCIEKCETVGQFTKISLSNNFLRVKTRNYWEAKGGTFEADIQTNKRFLLDRSMDLHNEHIPYTFYDIETDDRKPLQKDDKGNVVPVEDARVLSFAAVDYKGDVAYFELEEDTAEAEYKLLTQIIKYFANYGIISGWHSEGFDMPYIKGRCDALGIDYQILDYINHLCYKLLFQKYDKKSRPSFSLNAISNEVLNESKIDQAKGNGAIYNTWLNDKKQLKKYNIEDANLIYKINKEVMFIEVSMKRADRAQCHVRNTMHNADGGDILLMRAYKNENIIMSSKPTKEQVEKRKLQGKIGGGYTTCFKPGLHDGVVIFDFKSEYPSAMQSWNVSPETYVESINDEETALSVDKTKFCTTPADFENYYHKHRIYRKEEGVIPKVVRMLVEERDLIKYTMKEFKETDPAKYKQLYLEQYAIKTDANSIYGILAFPYSRYYSWEVADSVTSACRATLKACNKEIEKIGCEVLGGDTDSTFVKLNGKTIEEVNEIYVKFLEEWTKKWNCPVNKLVFEYEKTYSLFFFVMKKNYAFVEDGKIGIKGMECIKADAVPVVAKYQREFIEDVLNQRVDDSKWEDKIKELHDTVFNQELTVKDVTLSKGISKMPADYEGYTIDKKTGEPKVKADGTLQKKSISGVVKLASRMLAEGEDIYPGSKIKYVVVADKPVLAIKPEEFIKGEGIFKHKHKKHGEIDYEFSGEYDAKYYWLRLIKPLIKVFVAYYGAIPNWTWNCTKGELNKITKSLVKD